VNNIRSTLATVWRIAMPYFRSEDKWAGRGLLAAVVSIELALVAINVLLNQWNARFYNALQDRNWDNFVREIGIFSLLAACFIALAVYQLYLNQWLQTMAALADPLSANGCGAQCTACNCRATRRTTRTSASPTT
jgi:putative ATP-binding cassette transporter